MINLLPPAIKHEQAYAKANARLLRYLWLSGIVSVVLIGIFGGTIFYLNLAQAQADRDLATTTSNIASYAAFRKDAKTVSDRLVAIKAIQAGQTHFSLLLSDIAKVLPPGTALDGITLTGDSAKPVQINVTAGTYEQALVFRNALVTSPRIAGVDLTSISKTDRGYATTVIIAFKPGAAR